MDERELDKAAMRLRLHEQKKEPLSTATSSNINAAVVASATGAQSISLSLFSLSLFSLSLSRFLSLSYNTRTHKEASKQCKLSKGALTSSIPGDSKTASRAPKTPHWTPPKRPVPSLLELCTRSLCETKLEFVPRSSVPSPSIQMLFCRVPPVFI